MADGNERSWEDHWAEGHIPWDAGRESPSLKKYVSGSKARGSARALVPGCGSGYDVFCLAHAGYSAIGVDIAPSARSRFSELRSRAAQSEENAQLVTGDFFSLTPDELGGHFDLIWDYTFYCAINPALRDAWREQMARLLAPDGRLLMLLFPVIEGAPEDRGPPYPLDPQKVVAQLSPTFRALRIEPATESHPGREGKEWLSVWVKRSTNA
jgi:SAM-dependent methyltransferase